MIFFALGGILEHLISHAEHLNRIQVSTYLSCSVRQKWRIKDTVGIRLS
jgi:hypothetical protein